MKMRPARPHMLLFSWSGQLKKWLCMYAKISVFINLTWPTWQIQRQRERHIIWEQLSDLVRQHHNKIEHISYDPEKPILKLFWIIDRVIKGTIYKTMTASLSNQIQLLHFYFFFFKFWSYTLPPSLTWPGWPCRVSDDICGCSYCLFSTLCSRNGRTWAFFSCVSHSCVYSVGCCRPLWNRTGCNCTSSPRVSRLCAGSDGADDM